MKTQDREEEQNQLEEEDFEEEAVNLDEGLTLEDLVKVDSEFEKYAPYIDTISKEIVDPQYKSDESILRNQNPSLEIVSQKLSYVCSKILKTGTAKALKPHSVQLLAVLKLVESVLSPEDGMKGSIGNIRTGEGKSFIIALVSIILQSYNQKIDIVTSNMELATRDWEEQKFYYDLFGITSGFLYDRYKDSAFRNTENDPEIDSNDENQYNVKVLERQIVYSTHVNFQWLYLRNIPFKNTMRDATAIVDEADNILLDGATNPALLANDFKIENSREVLKSVYKSVAEGKNLAETKKILIETFPGANFTDENVGILVNAAEQAQKSVCGEDYIVRDVEDPSTHKMIRKVQIIDKNTGFLQGDSRWSAYVHEMIEIKEGIETPGQSVAQFAMSPLIFFGAYRRLIGVTGSVGDENDIEDYKRFYRISAFDIPTNWETKREILLRVYDQSENLEEMIANETMFEAERGRPVLIILNSINATNAMKARYLPSANLIQGIEPNEDRKSIAKAGQSGTITVSTIAAGRGTNIKLSQKSVDAGGLHVIIAHLPKQSRTLIQNIGRSARQGQPGSATVYLQFGERFQGRQPPKKNTVNLHKLQERFLSDLVKLWPWTLSMKKKFTSSVEYRFGYTTDKILEANARAIADRYFWPNQPMDYLAYTGYINSIYHMIFAAWGDMYAKLNCTKESENFEYCLQKYEEMMNAIYKWIPQDCKDPGNLLKDWAERTGVAQEIFDLLYDHHEFRIVPEFINYLISLKKVQVHGLVMGANVKNFEQMLRVLPEEHQKAYDEYCEKEREYNEAAYKYNIDLAAHERREAERENVARARGEVYNRIRQAKSAYKQYKNTTRELRELREHIEGHKVEGPSPLPELYQEPVESQPEYREPRREPDLVDHILDAFGGTTAYACGNETAPPPEEKKGFLKSVCDGAGKVLEGACGAIINLIPSTTVYAPGPEDVLTYEKIEQAKQQATLFREYDKLLPTEGQLRSMLKSEIVKQERQLIPMPDSLPCPNPPGEPDWGSIGWGYFSGKHINVFNSILGRFIPPRMNDYRNSRYWNPDFDFLGRGNCFSIAEETEINRLAKEISEKIHPIKSGGINWKKSGKVVLQVGGIIILCAVNACSGGTLTPLQVIGTTAATGAIADGGGEILDQLDSGEPINWGAVLARTTGGAGKGALFGIPGLSGTKLFTGAAAIETAESYLHSAAKGDMSPEALGEAIGNGTISFVTFGLVDKAAKKILSPFMRDKLKAISEAEMSKSGFNPYEILDEHGIPTTLTPEQRAACDAEGLAMKAGTNANGRNLPGIATGGEKLSNVESMMRGKEGNLGVIPKEIADKMRGRQYSDFDAFREDFWKTVAESKYAGEFSNSNIGRMRKGMAPRVLPEQRYGGLKSYVLHHKIPIHDGGGVFDLDNITIVTPKMHQEILDKSYHFNK